MKRFEDWANGIEMETESKEITFQEKIAKLDELIINQEKCLNDDPLMYCLYNGLILARSVFVDEPFDFLEVPSKDIEAICASSEWPLEALNINPDYNILISLSDDGEGYEATCPEFPGLSVVSSDGAQSIQKLQEKIDALL